MRFTDKVALVTGGASGIGAEIARRLVAEGASVIIGDLAVAAGQSLAAELGEKASAIALDVASENDWAGARQTLQDKHGRLDVLINCAGIHAMGNVEDTSVELWRRSFDVNVLGVALGCRFAVEHMKQGSGGAIVNIASSLALRGDPAQLPYCTTKAAVINLTRSVAAHCGRQNYNIRCNSLLPGVVDTPMLRKLETDLNMVGQMAALLAGLHMLNRVGEVGEITDAALFLASDEASFITATALTVDGGMAEVWHGSM